MGRGRAKAKQTKVARELKYSSPSTDFDSLQRELSGGGSPISHRNTVRPPDEPDTRSRWDDDDAYEEWRR
ncbi:MULTISPECIES: DUF3073 domain-containing protein [Antrihabitans]|jgi:hypothetical protein|uniref:DUF3073 domain-containing protein n=2 Tax=Antrihabitans TaxID=2799491 RepID=A0A934U539_9NOCA|nr:DUF3073 domain-containing protein [Antrihabitans stalagmiti]MBJ8340413.1 DUF3073 domain-containing protein [Antrihabitans stalagmiti]